MTLAILETGAPPPPLAKRFGTYPDMFESLLGESSLPRFAVTEGQWPARIDAFDAYLVTGSPAGVYDPLPWIGELQDFLRRARGKAALVGICFGHQVMAEAFGGHVIKSPKGWGVGLQRYEVVQTAPWMDAAPSFTLPASHQDQVVIRPPDATVLAASPFTPMAALAYAGGDAISFQGHPEFAPEFAQALLQARRGTRLTDEEADAAVESLERPNDRLRVGQWIGRFLRRESVRTSSS